MTPDALSRMQQVALVFLRTMVGWHFLYEGFYKAMLPGWSSDGSPMARWSSAPYLKAATGPFADVFHGLAASPWLEKLDLLIVGALLFVGLSLMLGLFTQAGCVGAILLLTMFYLAQIPTRGLHETGSEGAYLFVNKNLIEAAAVFAVFAFRTGRIAGLDRLRRGPARERPRAMEAA